MAKAKKEGKVCQKKHICRYCGKPEKAPTVHFGKHSLWTSHYECARKAAQPSEGGSVK